MSCAKTIRRSIDLVRWLGASPLANNKPIETWSLPSNC